MIITLTGVAIYGPVVGSILCTIGVLLGSYCSFFLGKILGFKIACWITGKQNATKYAQIIISQYGGPDGELGASLRYLSQRYSMPFPELKGLLTDIGTEELGHLEMIGAIVYQLTRNLTK